MTDSDEAEGARRGEFLDWLIAAASFCFAAALVKLVLPAFVTGRSSFSSNVPLIAGLLAACAVSWRLRRRA